MKRTLLTIAFALALALAPASASALTLTIGDAYYLGSITDGIPSNPANEAAYINYLITLAKGAGDTQLPALTGEIYNRVGSTLDGPFPTAVVADSFKTTTENPPPNIDATGYTYVLGKYDAGQAGSLVWYFESGAPGEVTLPSKFNGLGLSHISLYNPTTVPDGGMTLMLLGGALVGLGALRRRLGA